MSTNVANHTNVKLAKIQKELNIVNQHTSSIQNIETQITEQFPRLDDAILHVDRLDLGFHKFLHGILGKESPFVAK